MRRRSIVAILLAGSVAAAVAQGYDTPLTMQGLHRTDVPSAAARGAGGIFTGRAGDATLLFAHPASLAEIGGLRIAIATSGRSVTDLQDQRFGGLQLYSAFTPLMMGTTHLLPDPADSLLVNQTDSVQRPFDTIGPNWTRTASGRLPVQVFAAAPFDVAGMTIVIGAGMAEYVNLDRFYQNNNSMSPAVLSVLDGTIPTTGLNTNPYLVQWFQYRQRRTGSINAYGAAVAAQITNRLAFGVSGRVLNGTTDDEEVRVGRGRLAFFANSLRISKEGMTSYTTTGTSDFSGTEFTASVSYTTRSVMFHAAVTPPSTITRSFRNTMLWDSVAAVSRLSHRVDSVHVSGTATVSGEDRMSLPWRAAVGLSITPKENWTVGLLYEVRPYRSAEYSDPTGRIAKPWLASAILRVGAEVRVAEWLRLRGGVTNADENFTGVAAALRNEPADYVVYALGVGVDLLGAQFDLAYEYSDRRYIDAWSNAASINRQYAHAVVAGVSYRFGSFNAETP